MLQRGFKVTSIVPKQFLYQPLVLPSKSTLVSTTLLWKEQQQNLQNVTMKCNYLNVLKSQTTFA